MSSIIVPYGYVLVYVLFSLRCILEAYQLLLGMKVSVGGVSGSKVVVILAYALFFLCSMWWAYKKYRLARKGPRFVRGGLTDDEYQTCVCIAIIMGSSIADIIVNILLDATTWRAVSEASLVSYTFILFVLNVFMTGPGNRNSNLNASFVFFSITNLVLL